MLDLEKGENMETQYQIILGAIGALLLIAQATLIGFKIMEKREARRLFSEAHNPSRPKMNGFIVPGFAQICMEHAKKLVGIDRDLKNLIKTRDEDHAEGLLWKTEVRDSFKRMFDRVDGIK